MLDSGRPVPLTQERPYRKKCFVPSGLLYKQRKFADFYLNEDCQGLFPHLTQNYRHILEHNLPASMRFRFRLGCSSWR